MNKELERLETNLSKYKTIALEQLSPPVNGGELKAFINEMYGNEIFIGEELEALYNWHNGTDASDVPPEKIKQCYLAYEFFFNGLQEICKILKADDFNAFQEKKLFPIFSSLNGEYFSLLLKEGGRIYYSQTFDEEVPFVVSMFDSISSLIKTINDLYEIGFYYVATDLNIVEADYVGHYQNYLKIGQTNNPSSEYWAIKIARENE